MKKIIVRAPVRADLAGGTLDLWPLYLFHPGARTVNVAISYYAESEVTETGTGAIELLLTDQQYRQRYESLQELASDPKATLVHRALEHFHIRSVRIVTRTDAPRGSGLGGSSALTVTLVRALSEMAGEPLDGEPLIALVRDLETRLIGIPAGIQDYYPPVYGGLASLHLNAGAPRRHPLPTSTSDLAAHMLLHYSGVAHFSGTNNWQIFKRQMEGKKKVQKGLAKIAATAIEMERALEAGNFEAAGAALAKEWQNRKSLIDGVSTPEVDQIIDGAVGAGAWGAKVCGAGGGGCIVILCPPERRDEVVRALSTCPGKLLDVVPVAHGMTIDRGEDQQLPLSPVRAHATSRRLDDTIEQLYVFGGAGPYKPFVLAEGVVTHNDSRSGVHQTAVHSYAAPIAMEASKVLWQEGFPIVAEDLDIRAVPDPSHRILMTITPEALVQVAAQSEEAFRQFLVERVHLHVFHNAAFGLYSDAGESREAFLERCLDEARRQVKEQTERLEATFRRRMDQLREKSEREQRDMDANDPGHEERGQDVGVAWGQALYNITSGRAAVSEVGHSVREVDYIENIAHVQRAWEKELEALRDDLTSKARSIEALEITPAVRDIEVARYVILWMAGDAVKRA